jgi:hypothetical protein
MAGNSRNLKIRVMAQRYRTKPVIHSTVGKGLRKESRPEKSKFDGNCAIKSVSLLFVEWQRLAV